MSSGRFIAIHGHFYQPPRENPWLEAVEVQDSAAPFHDWNERITAECYAPNTAARRVAQDNRILDIVNNFEKISFNVGPTLLAWLERHTPDAYHKILEADRRSGTAHGGHGNAIAQAYNHVILPLAKRRDKITQVQWGRKDFHEQFGREPEGMWLPETAVDNESLEILAEAGMKFTILAPHQAWRIRKIGTERWEEVNDRIDPSRPYLWRGPGGRTLTLFFYDGPISRAIAFENSLDRGEDLVELLLVDDRTQLDILAIRIARAQALRLVGKDLRVRVGDAAGARSDRKPSRDQREDEHHQRQCRDPERAKEPAVSAAQRRARAPEGRRAHGQGRRGHTFTVPPATAAR